MSSPVRGRTAGSARARATRVRSGHPFALYAAVQVDDCVADLGALGSKQQVTYQPADNFWALQWIRRRAT
ncbi:hypothetical protein ACFYVV_05385 [Streptomyces tendae]|uniref:hypothetical protein n=1 Tax=Streptomyces tendae TaxID=1932 RepID=UPI0036AD061C